ncbi:Xan family putative trans-acting RiPP leader peptide [Myxococcus vastator]|uniref:Xan family putative trans-acting RiPP leader peptide n=1 Tax=Myxococcus vastator TaxID=2709664 RepID=UPI0013D21F59|nr:Xan family putative trans-acting RiPP leader peptide [Myxococcus vastator]
MASEDTFQQVHHPVDASSVSAQPSAPSAELAAPEKLDEIEEIDFLLEEIESKIAPLALA